ncbi:MAG: phosphoribosylformylglycinamidine synthase subunit PurL [Planctomycetaceae bacterium]
MPLWQIDIYPAEGFTDRDGQRISEQIHELGLGDVPVSFARGYLIEGDLDLDAATRMASTMHSDSVTERTVVAIAGDDCFTEPPGDNITLVHVMPKPGVMDPVAQSTIAAARDSGWDVDAVRTLRKYWLPELPDERLERICRRALSNDSVDQVIVGPLELDHLAVGGHYEFALKTIAIRDLNDEALQELSRVGQLYLTLIEMQTIRDHFRELGRDPTDIELETVAQTWSEHCSHKTLGGRIAYRGPGPDGTPGADVRQYKSMLKETIFAATQTLRAAAGEDDMCVSVFKDNAGVVKFNDEYHACFKVETHNHPSALEPYGGANTGLGGVIRDPMGTGLGAKPVCNTDVFCFAPPDTPADSLPPGVLHPRRVMNGVVAGVRDYGNRMGIPTVNGAIYFDKRYLGNPLVYCGNVAMIPVGMEHKRVEPHDLIVAMGGRTGRDGIHGATFSSAELTSESESLSGGAVQIGNAITEKMVMDVLLQARDRGLYNAVTDCGAGGFSSAVGEMGEELGAEVWLEKCPLKYDGLSHTEIWISEAQERMVLAVPVKHWQALQELCASEGVEVAAIGEFVPTGRLHLTYKGKTAGDVSMQFLHEGRPPVVRDAIYVPPDPKPLETPALDSAATTSVLYDILGSLNVASKHWVIRQYDHEVQGGSVVKPLVGPQCDGPSDAAVIRPLVDSRRGLVIACGMNPYYGDHDTYHMAASAIDEAMRNAVAVGANPANVAILDNFCWGYTDRPETLGSLVRAAIACQDMAVELGTPFISGKDSLNNEFSYVDGSGQKQSISIPPSLLISAMGQIEDVSLAVTMDLKKAGNEILLIGETREELGGSHYTLVRNLEGGQVPIVDAVKAKSTFAAVHSAMQRRQIRSCHDLSEGGLAIALAEMAMAGRLGARVDIAAVGEGLSDTVKLFSESNTRFLIEVTPENVSAVTAAFAQAGVSCLRLGQVTEEPQLRIDSGDQHLIDQPIQALLERWQKPLDW